VGAHPDLLRAVERQLADAECWQVAEWHLLTAAFAERLAALGIEASSETGAVLIAAALFLADETAEWGGDARDALGELAQLGRSLIPE
jgi:hypothetical protein